jgi:hypothetical protein
MIETAMHTIDKLKVRINRLNSEREPPLSLIKNFLVLPIIPKEVNDLFQTSLKFEDFIVYKQKYGKSLRFRHAVG